MTDFRIRYARQAIDDLDAIFDYVCLENPAAAEKLLSAFDSSISRLQTTPYMGAALRTDQPMFVAQGYRYLVVSPYLVFYRVDGRDVYIGPYFAQPSGLALSSLWHPIISHLPFRLF